MIFFHVRDAFFLFLFFLAKKKKDLFKLKFSIFLLPLKKKIGDARTDYGCIKLPPISLSLSLSLSLFQKCVRMSECAVRY